VASLACHHSQLECGRGRQTQTQKSGSRRDHFLPPSLAASASVLSTPRSRVACLVSGAIFGTLMERWTRNQQHAGRQRTAALTEDLTPEERTTALKASRRGQLPVDPRAREAAAAIIQYRLELINRQATKNSLGLAAFMVFYVLMAVFSSAWWWLGFLLFAFFLTMGWWQPKMLQHRLTLLAR
jgi:hypothetical protein